MVVALLIVEKGVVVVTSGARSKTRIVLGFGLPGTLLPPPFSRERLVALADSILISISPAVQRVQNPPARRTISRACSIA